jgi:hypothetical protein
VTDQPPQTTWAAVDLGPVLNGEHLDPPPTILERTGGGALIYASANHSLSGEPESCKGWITLAACAEQMANGHRVLYVDFEDNAGRVVGRLLALSLDQQAIRDLFVYVRPDEPLGDAAKRDLATALAGGGITLAVLDGITEGMTMQGLDLMSNTDVAKWIAMLPRKLTSRGIAVLQVDHEVKDKEARGRYAIGAQHKLAGVDVGYKTKVIAPFGRGRIGRIALTVTKDRPGHVRGSARTTQVAEIELVSGDDGAVTITVNAAIDDGQDSGGFRPTVLMERVSRAVEEHPGLSKRALRDTVKGRAAAVDLALELLIADGYLRVEKDGQASRHHSQRAYREDDDTHRVPVSAPCPDRVPDRVSVRVPVSPLLTGDTGHATGHGPDTDPDDAYLQALIDGQAA